MIHEERRVKFGLDAADIKDLLRRHHPGEREGSFVGRWTCLEEWCGIDLLALDAWSAAHVIGYEVKVSRSDLRSELLNPAKRHEAVSRCTRFYIATPAGLLKPDELAWQEPDDWTFADYERDRCTNPGCSERFDRRGFRRNAPKPRGSKLRGTEREGATIHIGFVTERSDPGEVPSYSHTHEVRACCNVCKGYGTVAKSKVESLAPTLWVPSDVGLVEVTRQGVSVVKEAPLNKLPKPILGSAPSDRINEVDRNRLARQQINDIVRWASNRPDPRHRQPYSDRMEP